jgi:signal transduction histidine kinase
MTETLQMLSHEWRQPLNIISIRAQKLELDLTMGLDSNKEAFAQSLKEIKDDAQKLSDTIEEFQSFVKLKSEKEKIIAKDVILKAVEIFKKDPESKDIDFIKDVTDIPAFNSYKSELTTILVNILVNAKEAIFRKKIKNGVIKLTCYCLNNTIFFEISDNAGGIDEDIIDKIFEPYFSTKNSKHGVGLGLYTCKIITEMHLMGEISVTNHNSGATFKIALPI